MKDKSLWILIFRDGECFGSTQPMSKLECDVMTKQALSIGYDVAAVCIDKVFEVGKYAVVPVFSDWKFREE